MCEVVYRNTEMRKKARGRGIPTNGVKKILTPRKLASFFYDVVRFQDETSTLFATSHRIVINRAVDTMIISTTVMLIMYHCHGVLMLRVCLKRHLVILRVQILTHMAFSTTVRGTSTSMSD